MNQNLVEFIFLLDIQKHLILGYPFQIDKAYDVSIVRMKLLWQMALNPPENHIGDPWWFELDHYGCPVIWKM